MTANKLAQMSLSFLFFSCLIWISLTKEYDFSYSVNESKLLKWVDSDGKQQQLFLTRLQIVQKTTLVKKSILPYTYLVDENCGVTQSLTQATIFEEHTIEHIKLEYIHMEGQQIISKSTVDFTTNTTIKLNIDVFLHISAQPSSYKPSNKSEIEESQIKKLQSLYMYGEQRLVSFDSKIFSFQPSCYMLSPMTVQLCKTQSCLTLPPQQVYQMDIGTQVSNYSIVNNQIVLPSGQSKNQLIYLKLQSLDSQESTQLLTIKEEIVTISGKSIIKVNFQLSQTPISQNNNQSHSLRVNNPSLLQQFQVKITLTNPQPTYTIKTIKLIKGEQLIESYKIMFKPLQQIFYSIVWQNDQSQTPSIEIYSQNMQFQGKYTMNSFIDFQYNQQTLLMKSSPLPNTIQTATLQQLTTSESHIQKFPLIIVLAISGGVFLFIISGLLFFRKIVFKKFIQSQNQEKNKQNSVKKETQCENIQSAKHLADCYEFTFQKKQSLFTQTPSSLSKVTQNKTQNLNPECTQFQEENKNQCSIEEQLPKNSPSQKAQDKYQPKTAESLPDSKMLSLSRGDQSLSLTSNYSKSYAKKPLTKKCSKKSEQAQQTQNV